MNTRASRSSWARRRVHNCMGVMTISNTGFAVIGISMWRILVMFRWVRFTVETPTVVFGQYGARVSGFCVSEREKLIA